MFNFVSEDELNARIETFLEKKLSKHFAQPSKSDEESETRFIRRANYAR